MIIVVSIHIRSPYQQLLLNLSFRSCPKNAVSALFVYGAVWVDLTLMKAIRVQVQLLLAPTSVVCGI